MSFESTHGDELLRRAKQANALVTSPQDMDSSHAKAAQYYAILSIATSLDRIANALDSISTSGVVTMPPQY